MESYFERQVKDLYDKVNNIIDSADMYKAKRNGEEFRPEITKEFKEEFLWIFFISNGKRDKI